jgi:integrase
LNSGPLAFRKVLQRLATVAKLPISVNPHALRHACGFKLAADGVDTRGLSHYLGHRSLQSTERIDPGSYVAVGMLVVGFVLQLIAAIRAK